MGTTASKPGGGGPAGAPRSFLLDAIHEHGGGINCMALSEDGSILATGSEDRSVRLWSTKTKRCDCIGILTGHLNYVSAVAIEDEFVVSGSADSTLRKYDMSTCTCVLTFTGHSGRVNRVICTGDFIFSSSVDRTVRCWDFDRGTCIREFNGHQNGVFPIAFVPVEDGEEEGEGEGEGERGLREVEGGRYSPKINDLVISGSTDCTARSWSFETGRCVRTFRGHTGAVTCLATCADARTLYTASTDSTLRSWGLESGEPLRVFNGHRSTIVCMTVVNRVVYTGSADRCARAWAGDQSESIALFKGQEHTIMCIKQCDGMLMTGSGDGTVHCFDTKTGNVKRVFKGPADIIVNTLQVVESRLFTGSTDGTLRMWTLRGVKEEFAGGGGAADNNSEWAGASRPTSRYPSTGASLGVRNGQQGRG